MYMKKTNKNETYMVVLQQDIYTTVKIKASSEDEANELVMMGEFNDEDIIDVTTDNSEIIETSLIKNHGDN